MATVNFHSDIGGKKIKSVTVSPSISHEVVGSDTYTCGIKDFHKCWLGSLAKRRLCLGPTGVINCTPLSALSFWVSLFPGMCGYTREIMETVTDFIFLDSKIIADDDCIHEIKRRLLLGRKAMTNIDNILKSRDITLPTKVHLVKVVFSSSLVWMWELDYKES